MTTPTPSNEYRVEWTIDITAEDPEAAAREAHEIMLDPAAFPPCFDVTDTNTSPEETVTVDLHEIGLSERGL